MSYVIRKVSANEGWEYDARGNPLAPSGKATCYVITQNGKRIDSFLSKSAAEAKVRALIYADGKALKSVVGPFNCNRRAPMLFIPVSGDGMDICRGHGSGTLPKLRPATLWGRA